jgi:hypothetical protein
VSIPDTIATEDSLYSYHVKVEDIDEEYGRDTTRISFIVQPSWIHCDSSCRTISGIPRWYNDADTTIVIRIIDTHGGELFQQWNISVNPSYHLPTSFKLFSNHSDTVQIDLGRKLTFAWFSSADEDVEDTLFYSFHLWGDSYDTSIVGIKDTSIVLDVMNKLKTSSIYRWSVSVTDQRFVVPSMDTLLFSTKRDILFAATYLDLIPKEHVVYQNFPNPFNATTTIRFAIPTRCDVIIDIFNSIGQRVTSLVHQELNAKYYEVVWDAQGLSSGVYFMIVRMNDFNQSDNQKYFIKKLLLLK